MDQKRREIERLFSEKTTPEGKYELIIELGRKLPKMDPVFCSPENLVEGCQSLMYLKADYTAGKFHFEIFSEALISAGLAALLIHYYEGQGAEAILTHPPTFINDLGITASLSPGRSNGLSSLYKKIKQTALQKLIEEKQAAKKPI